MFIHPKLSELLWLRIFNEVQVSTQTLMALSSQYWWYILQCCSLHINQVRGYQHSIHEATYTRIREYMQQHSLNVHYLELPTKVLPMQLYVTILVCLMGNPWKAYMYMLYNVQYFPRPISWEWGWSVTQQLTVLSPPHKCVVSNFFTKVYM